MMDSFCDAGLSIEGISADAAEAIKSTVLAFRSKYNLAETDWYIKVFGASHGQMSVWIGKGPSHVREPYTLNATPDRAAEIAGILERLLAEETAPKDIPQKTVADEGQPGGD
jgi:hypothetical protein